MILLSSIKELVINKLIEGNIINVITIANTEDKITPFNLGSELKEAIDLILF